MSDNLTVMPSRPKAQAPSAAETAKWMTAKGTKWQADFFRVRGWKSNNARNKGLKATLDAVLKPGGRDSAAALLSERLEAGPEFKTYLQCLAAFERSPDANNAASLSAAAQGYLDHYDAHSDREKKQKNTARKAEVCLKTLTEVQCWQEIQSIGEPPWTSKVAMRAATIKAELDFASLPLGGQTAQTLVGKGVNPTFWVNRADKDPGKPQKTYLLKPTTAKTDREGIPSGGEPAREALTGRAADILNGMTGIDFKVPDTHIVSVARKRFEGIELDDSVVDRDGQGPLVGSLQQFAASKGELRDNAPDLARGVSPKRCQELAILDIVTMHVDRHGGNYMIDGVSTDADLVPIDNGLSFPDTPTSLSYMATGHNALLGLPGSHEPFTDEMRDKIASINPAALKAALKSEVGDIASVHPSASGKIADSALEQARRAAMFLKQASRTLTPAGVQVALGQNAETLFDTVAITTDAAFAALAARVIAETAREQASLAEYFQLSETEKSRIQGKCQEMGWDTDELSIVQIMKVFKSNADKPAETRPAFGGAPPTDDEKRDMLLVFPRAKPDDQWFKQQIGNWRALAPFGDARTIKAKLFAATAKGSNPETKTSVRREPGLALDLLRAQRAVDALPQIDEAAGRSLILDGKRDMIKGLLKSMTEPAKSQISQSADALRAAKDANGLNKLRDQLSGVLRAKLLAELPVLAQKISRLPAGPIRIAALEALENGESLIRSKQDMLGAQALIDDAKLKAGIGSF